MPHSSQNPSQNFGGNVVEQDITAADSLMPKKPGLTMHSLFLVLMIMFMVSLAFVLGLNYFFDGSAWHSQTTQYLCPGVTGSTQQLAICFRG